LPPELTPESFILVKWEWRDAAAEATALKVALKMFALTKEEADRL
jgi:hypothetical protein